MASEVRRLNQAMTLVALLGAAVIVVLLVMASDWRLVLLPIVVTGIVLLLLGLTKTSRTGRETAVEYEPPKRRPKELRMDRLERLSRRRRPSEPTPLRPPPREPPSPRPPA